jgi:dinuclear metal center YbgI/SA1388 family protein
MTVRELYGLLEARYPSALSAEWDHDGLQCSPDPSAPVRRVLTALDVTEATVERAVAVRADVILSHHPLLFHPLHEVVSDAGIGRRIARLFSAGISVMSFHTRLDAVSGGVNDVLASLFGLADTVSFTEEGIGVIGTLPESLSAEALASLVKKTLGSHKIEAILSARPCRRLAVVGGDGKDFIEAAAKAGADAYLTGNMSYNSMTDGEALGITLIAAGHYETENPVLPRLADWVTEITGGVEAEIFACNRIHII